jgi:hypothetical protein
MSTKAMKQALEALKRADKISGYPNNKQTITALRQAIQEAEKQEPVAWSTEVKNGKLFFHIGNQSFLIDYIGTKEAMAWMEKQLQDALSKLASPPQPHGIKEEA